ncbi:MAG: glycosyl hydrolase 53 family protein [Candidatus Dojkabacteria bacterium]
MLVIVLFTAACNPSTSQEDDTDPLSYETVSLSTKTRRFKVGIAGFGPTNFPQFNINDLTQYWRNLDDVAELYGVHTKWTETDFITDARKNTDLPFEVVLGFQRVNEWENSVNEYTETARQILRADPGIKYFAIGNEINIQYEKEPDKFDTFVSAYKSIYKTLKEEFPEVQIFTVFQYEALLGEAFLTGAADLRDSEVFLLDKFDDTLDLIGLTLYPYFDHTDPNLIPDDYFAPVAKYGKPLAVTETGWMSRTSFSGPLEALSDMGYTGSQQQQVDYLLKLIELAEEDDFEFINWFFINDVANWVDGDTGSDGLEIFDSISLRDNQGNSKLVWDYWLSLKQTPFN